MKGDRKSFTVVLGFLMRFAVRLAIRYPCCAVISSSLSLPLSPSLLLSPFLSPPPLSLYCVCGDIPSAWHRARIRRISPDVSGGLTQILCCVVTVGFLHFHFGYVIMLSAYVGAS
jgi:hypothetical protein